MLALANWITGLLDAYVFLGVVFGVPFVVRGVTRIDPVAREGTWGFRLIIFPGVVALWPILAARWIAGGKPPRERNAHRDAAARMSKAPGNDPAAA